MSFLLQTSIPQHGAHMGVGLTVYSAAKPRLKPIRGDKKKQ